MRIANFSCLIAASMGLFLSGCGDDGAPAGAQAPVAAVAASIDPGDAADDAVKTLIAGLKQGRPEAFWEFLPSDFQDDLNDLIHQFAGRMDSELWDKTVALLRKMADMLKAQKQFLAGAGPAASSATGRAPQADHGAGPGAADWSKAAEMLETVLDSDLASLKRLKSADGGKLLATAGGKVLEQARKLSRLSPDDDFAFSLDRLDELRVSVVHSSSDQSSLKFEAPGDTPLIVKFVRHRGKWIPEDLETEWLHRIGNAKAWLSSALSPEAIAEQKPRYLTVLSAADAALDKMAAAQTRDEFAISGQQATLAIISLFAVLSSPAPSAEPVAAETPPLEAKEVVTVIVAGTLDDDAQDALSERIKAVAEDPDRAAAEITGDDETSTFKVGPVTDVEAFAKRLEFLEITGVDVKTRTITAKPRK